jgi:3-hydroxybutyryl-CoA dehydrogenase
MTADVQVPQSAAVIGGGAMGAGIAHVLLDKGAHVTIAESSTELAEMARDAVAASLGKAHDRGKLGIEPTKLLAHLTCVAGVSELPEDAQLVIEAVPERLELKQAVLDEVGRRCPGAVLASNTSSLSITALADGLPAERVIGMHFFNPVPVQQLVELVHHDGASDRTKADAKRWAEAMGKTVIEVRDSPGFATSRLGLTVGLEAIRMLEEGVASAEDIDTGMALGYRWPMGPLKLTDLVGLDVRLAVADYLTEQLGPRFEPPKLLRDKVKRGELGRKSGQGFFAW